MAFLTIINRNPLRSRLWVLLFPGLLVTGLNLNTFDNAWTFDDEGLVVNNADVKSLIINICLAPSIFWFILGLRVQTGV